MKTIKQTVFIIDDDPAILEMLQWLIKSIDVNVKTFQSGQDFLNNYKKSLGCLILDVRLKDMSGLNLQETLIARGYYIPVIFITGHGDIPMTVRAMKNGSVDFFTKPFNNQLLLEAIQKTLEQNIKKYYETLEKEELNKRINNLTPREYEIMMEVIFGQSNKMIAKKLHISINTVETHRAKVMHKMHVKTLVQLIRLLLKHNIISID